MLIEFLHNLMPFFVSNTHSREVGARLWLGHLMTVEEDGFPVWRQRESRTAVDARSKKQSGNGERQ